MTANSRGEAKSVSAVPSKRIRKTQAVLPKSTILFFADYKDPLHPVEDVLGKGYGYMGTLATDKSGNFIQCHLCGNLYEYLNQHLRRDHKMKVAEYKEKFGLAQKTALIGERARKIATETAMRLIKEGKMNPIAQFKKGHKKTNKNRHGWNLERRNKRGSCPEQTITAIQQIAKLLGHTPSCKEYDTYSKDYRLPARQTVVYHFGSWQNAVSLAGLTPNLATSQGEAMWTKQTVIRALQNFYLKHSKTPTSSDFRRGIVGPPHKAVNRYFPTLNLARQVAGIPQLVRLGVGHNTYVEVGTELNDLVSNDPEGKREPSNPQSRAEKELK